MARHNRHGEGVDQAGFVYEVSYPPDWLRQIRVGRTLASGRRSTQTLFRNPRDEPQAPAGELRRVHIRCIRQDVDLTVTIQSDPGRCQRVVVDFHVSAAFQVVGPEPAQPEVAADVLTFVLEGGLP
jgi:hypothetical protein